LQPEIEVSDVTALDCPAQDPAYERTLTITALLLESDRHQ